jgi:hypothetical protein
MTDDETTSRAFQLPPVTWPITLQFDKKRLTTQFRQEFQNIMAMSILMIPYRHYSMHLSHIQSLKQFYLDLIKKPDPQLHHKLAAHICKVVGCQDDVSLWENWLLHNLEASSAIYKLMYNRLCHHLQFFSQHECMMETATKEMTALEGEIKTLGKKLKMVADLNLETYGSVYKNIINNIIK